MSFLSVSSSRSIVRAAVFPLIVGALLVLVGCSEGQTTAEQEYRDGISAFDQGDVNSAIIHLKNAIQKDPHMLPARSLLGRAYLVLGDILGAEKELRRVLDNEPEDAASRLYFIEALNVLRRYQDVLDILAGLDLSPGELVERAIAESGLGQTEKALTTIHRALGMDPDSSAAYMALALINWQRGDTETAMQQVEKAIERAPDDMESWVLKGQLAYSESLHDAAIVAMEKALSIQKYRPSLHGKQANITLAMAWFAKTEFEKAAAYVEAVGKMDARGLSYKFLKATLHFYRGDLDSAILLLREVLKNSPKHSRTLMLSGVIEVQRGNLHQAQEYLQRALSTNPNLIYARRLLGAVYLKLDIAADAVKVLEPLARALPGDGDVLGLLGTAYLENGQINEATDALSRAAVLEPENISVRATLGYSFFVRGNSAEAISKLTEIVEEEPDFHKADFLLAISHLHKGDSDSAMKVAGELVKKQPGNALYQNLMGFIQQLSGDDETARESYRKARQIDSEYVTPLMNLARMELQAGSVAAAVALYDEVLRKQPQHAGALYGQAMLLSREGNLDKAMELLQRACDGDPGDIDARIALARMYLQRNQYREGLQVAKQVLARHPEQLEALLLAGRFQLLLGKLKDAAATAELSIEINPDSAQVYYLSALVAAQQGEMEVSRNFLKQALKLNSGFNAVKLMLAKISLSGQQGLPKEFLTFSAEDAGEQSTQDVMLMVRQLLDEGNLDRALFVAQENARLRPQETLSQFLLAVVHRARSESDQARDVLEAEHLRHPEKVSPMLNLADLEMIAGNSAKARDWYQKVLELQPENETALLSLAGISEANEAFQLVKHAFDAHPNSIRSSLSMTAAYLQRQKIQDALPIAASLLERAPGDPQVLQLASRAYLSAGNIDLAEKVVGEYRKRFPAAADAYHLSALVMLAKQNFGASRTFLAQALELEPDNINVKVTQAELDYSVGKFQAASNTVNEILRLQPSMTRVRSLQADIAWKMGKQTEAVGLYRKLWQLHASAENAVKVGRALWASGDRESGLAFLRERLAARPKASAIRHALADMLNMDGMLSEAVQEYQAILQDESENTEVMNKLAHVYAQQGDKRALELASRGYQIDPQFPEMLDTYGWLLVKDGDINQGLNILRKAVSLESRFALEADRGSARYHLAVAYRKSGDKISARDELTGLLQSGIDFPERDKARLALKRLQ